MQQDRAGETEVRIALAVPEQEPRDSEEQCEGGGHRGVELLARVEPAWTAGAAPQPAAIVLVETVELAQRRDHALAVADGDDEGEHDQPGDAGVEMDFLDERPACDEHAQLGQVEHESRGEQREEAERKYPVHRALGAGEAPDEGPVAARAVNHGHSSARPRRCGRSRGAPRSRRPLWRRPRFARPT